MIAFDGVVVRYPGATRDAVHDVSFTSLRGRMTAIVGPNGSGKSTLVSALLGRQRLAGGAIAIDGHQLAALSRAEVARRVAVVTQREELAFPTPVRDYIALGRFPHRGGWRATVAADHAATERAVALAGVAPLLDRTVDTLSGGEWQRTRIARALAQGGQAIVLDEPTTYLDVAHEMEAFELLGQLAHAGMAVLLVSHQLNLVARFADLLVLLHDGSVAASGAPDEVMRGEILERVYGWPLVVTRDPAVGAPALVPLRGRARAAPLSILPPPES
ncbi:MAG: ABC transporter ATP-binding protein [Gemmatimonadota bacterium]|nr:ABC transporter ATP-binding protein [Gemmatimonadota bacterium]